MRQVYAALLVAMVLILSGCSSTGDVMDGDGMMNSYTQISQEQAAQMMDNDDGHIIVDVRTREEYDGGHVPNAICIPNESIGDTQPEELPDLGQIILVYCRSGRRSKEAAQKLFDIGYTNVYEFGGIIDWTGDVVTDEDQPNIEVEDVGMETEEEPMVSQEPRPVLVITANRQDFIAELADNSSADELVTKLVENGFDGITVDMHDFSNFEKVGELPWSIERNDEDITTEPGDIILYQGNRIVIYYDQNSWDFMRIGKIEGVTTEELLDVLGEGDVTVKFHIEYTE